MASASARRPVAGMLVLACMLGGMGGSDPTNAQPAVPAPDMVLRWNEVLLNAIRTDRTPPPKAARNMAMVHVAIYDAVNAIDRRYQPYRVVIVPAPDALPEAAAAAAAHAVLSHLYPGQRPTLDRHFADSLAQLPPAPGVRSGVELGQAVARQIIAWRSQDGADAPGLYRPKNRTGFWVPTPPDHQAALLPAWGSVTPFALKAGVMGPVDGPPPLTSAAYTQAFEEVRLLGGRDNSLRTADQTQIAHFWSDGPGTSTPPGHWNHIARTVAMARGNSLAENARLFALLNIAMADSGIVCWWCKFQFDFWRPVTAIRLAEHDGNPETAADPNWTPLLPTPNFPAYTSGHSSFSAAAASVLATYFGSDRVAFLTNSEGLPGVTRRFATFSSAADEAARSRIYGGIHWTFDNLVGLQGGAEVGQYVTTNYLLPVTPR